MSKYLLLMVCIAVTFLSVGCEKSNGTAVTAYGPDHLVCSGDMGRVRGALLLAISELSAKEILDDGSIDHPTMKNFGNAITQEGNLIMSKHFMQCEDEEGASYKCTIVTLGDRDPIITLESTSEDTYKFMNAINVKLRDRGIAITHYK